MATNDDMREQLTSLQAKFGELETKFDGLGKKIDQLPTAADFAKMTDKVTILLEEAKVSVQNAAEGYGATLGRIERELGEFRAERKNKAEDTDRVLANHVDRIVTLERVTGVTRDEPS